MSPLDQAGAFDRMDDGDDLGFYARDRFVSHLDRTALDMVERIVGTLIVEAAPVILDLMAGWDSHVPAMLRPAEVVGLGLNENELQGNPALTRYVIHDLNQDPVLPFKDRTFDVVINTVSVDYMTRPVEVFEEVGRILKPGGLFLVIFSNRMFPGKAVRVWKESGEEERVLLVEELFDRAGRFERPEKYISLGKPRPQDDKYAGVLDLSDPVYAVYAERSGRSAAGRTRPELAQGIDTAPGGPELECRKAEVGRTRCCPYCGERLKKWAVPDNPFSQTWDNEFMYICFNDQCPYYVRGWEVMTRGLNRCHSYRLMYHPEKDRCMPVPVPTPKALRESIVEEDA